MKSKTKKILVLIAFTLFGFALNSCKKCGENKPEGRNVPVLSGGSSTTELQARAEKAVALQSQACKHQTQARQALAKVKAVLMSARETLKADSVAFTSNVVERRIDGVMEALVAMTKAKGSEKYSLIKEYFSIFDDKGKMEEMEEVAKGAADALAEGLMGASPDIDSVVEAIVAEAQAAEAIVAEAQKLALTPEDEAVAKADPSQALAAERIRSALSQATMSAVSALADVQEEAEFVKIWNARVGVCKTLKLKVQNLVQLHLEKVAKTEERIRLKMDEREQVNMEVGERRRLAERVAQVAQARCANMEASEATKRDTQLKIQAQRAQVNADCIRQKICIQRELHQAQKELRVMPEELEYTRLLLA
jgi:hypothetical protein